MRFHFCATILVLAYTTGCASFSSTMLNRLEDNSFVGNSNGDLCSNDTARPFKGVPITLQVPSHLDVFIEETYYLEDKDSAAASLQLVRIGRILNVRTEVIKSKKVFVVDFKRPASGSLNLTADFNEQQYFKQIVSQLEDTTIVDSANLLGTALKFATAKPASAGGDGTRSLPKHLRQVRVVAYRRFDINDPDYEMQVEEFVNTHLNSCDSCNTSPTYDLAAGK